LLKGVEHLVPGLPRLTVEQHEVVAHGGRILTLPCDNPASGSRQPFRNVH
jgi:hypothetical protein